MNRSFHIQLMPFLKNASLRRGAIFGGMILCALLAFEVFNFGTTSFALRDVLGDLGGRVRPAARVRRGRHR